MAILELNSVGSVAWEILMRPHHRARWTAWSRPGLRGDDEDGAQTCIAWVIDDYRYDDAKERWKEPNSSPSARSAVQRLFRQGARPVPNATDEMPLRQLTKSRVLSDLVAAFEVAGDELDEIRSAFRSTSEAGTAHMGQSFHNWDLVQSDDDLKAVVQLSRRVIGGHAGFKADTSQPPTDGDIAPLREFIGRRADAVQLCVRNDVEGKTDTLVGYMLAYPVAPDAAQGLLTGSIQEASQIGPERIANRAVDEAALYVGMVLGSDLSARSTADGERWLEKYGFRPVAGRDHIWVRQASTPLAQPRRRRLTAATV